MPDYTSPAAKRRHERSSVVQPRETAYGGYEGHGTQTCPCRGYVMAHFVHGTLVRIELHHQRLNGCVPNIETLHLKSWLGTIAGPTHIPKNVLDTYGTADTGSGNRLRTPSRQRRDRTADGRDRR